MSASIAVILEIVAVICPDVLLCNVFILDTVGWPVNIIFSLPKPVMSDCPYIVLMALYVPVKDCIVLALIFPDVLLFKLFKSKAVTVVSDMVTVSLPKPEMPVET